MIILYYKLYYTMLRGILYNYTHDKFTLKTIVHCEKIMRTNQRFLDIQTEYAKNKPNFSK